MLVVYIIILIEMSNEKSCGIPVREWCLVFFTLWLGKGCFNMFKILVLNNSYESRTCFSFTTYMIISSLMVVWVILGSVWFFSDQNDCDNDSTSAFFYYLMLVLLIIGYIIILFWLLCLFIVPCIVMRAQNKQDRAFKETGEFETDKEKSWILKKLSRTQYDPQLLRYENRCILCMEKYQEDSKVTVMACDEYHYFHR